MAFEKLKAKIENHILAEIAAGNLGHVAVVGPENGSNVSLEPAETFGDKLTKIEEGQTAFVKEALDRGAAQEDLPALVADAMNSNTVARIAKGLGDRGGRIELKLLDGEIPADALSIDVRNPNSAEYMRANVYLSGKARSGESFSITPTDMLNYIGPEPVDSTVMAQIDAHMPVPQDRQS